MFEITVKSSGMMCGGCEARVNGAVKSRFGVESVSSDHAKGETVILSASDIPDGKLAELLDDFGYEFKGVSRREL